MSSSRKKLSKGDIVQHFKYQYNTKEDCINLKYVYEIMDFVQDADTEEWFVLYRSLYTPHRIWIRKMDSFLSEVDHNKYPDIKQKYRFEAYKGESQ